MIIHFDIGVICHFLPFNDKVLGLVDQTEHTKDNRFKIFAVCRSLLVCAYHPTPPLFSGYLASPSGIDVPISPLVTIPAVL
jgi:hypothetical protein